MLLVKFCLLTVAQELNERISIISFIKKTKALKAIKKNIPEEDMAVFKVLVKCELQKLDEEARDREFRRLERQINLNRSSRSEYAINKANEKEKQAMKKELEETLDKLNDAVKQSSNESYDIYDNKGNYIGRADKK